MAACKPGAKAPWRWDGWKAGTVRLAVRRMAEATGADPAGMAADGLRQREEWARSVEGEIARLEEQLAWLGRQAELGRERALRAALLPDADCLDRIIRYEAHLGRQLQQSLDALERLRSARARTSIPPLSTVNVTLPGPPDVADVEAGTH